MFYNLKSLFYCIFSKSNFHLYFLIVFSVFLLQVIQFSLWHAYVHEQYGRMYKYLQKLCDEKRNRENFEEIYLIAGALKYEHLQTVVQRLTVSTFPQSYRLF